jgi:hypothetical protein
MKPRFSSARSVWLSSEVWRSKSAAGTGSRNFATASSNSACFGARLRSFSISSARISLVALTNNCFFQLTSARRITCGKRLRMTASIGQQ